MRLGSGILIVGAILNGIGVRTASAPEQSLAQRQSSIRVQVLDGNSDNSVVGARVVLEGTSDLVDPAARKELTQPTRSVEITDGKGAVSFSRIDPGTYTLTVTKLGYVDGSYGQRGPTDLSRPFHVEGNEARGAAATVHIWRPAAIAGRVVDGTGEPAVGVQVRALRVVHDHGIRTTLAGETKTDDRGEYRLSGLLPGQYVATVPFTSFTVPRSSLMFVERTLNGGADAARGLLQLFEESGARKPTWSGLAIGDHVVQSLGSFSSVSMDANAASPLLTCQTVYLPNGSTPDQAVPISLESGAERSGVDFRIQFVPSLTVSGRLLGPRGPAPNVGVHLVADERQGRFTNDWTLDVASTLSDPDGYFTFIAVPAGQYLLEVLKVPSREFETSKERILFAKAPISLATGDVESLSVALTEGGRLQGRIQFSGSLQAPSVARMREIGIALQSVDSALVVNFPPTHPSDDGAFQTRSHPPGRYLVAVSAPPDWSLESVSLNGHDASDAAFELAADDVSGVLVTFTDRRTSLSGVVQASKEAAEGLTVVAFPADFEAWIAGGLAGRRLHVGFTERNGAFAFHNMAPGEYLVAAIDGQAPDMHDPDAIRAVARTATHLSLPQGTSGTINLRSVTRRGRPQRQS